MQRWTRPARVCEDPTKLALLAKRVGQVMATALTSEPLRLDPHSVGVSPVQQVHNIILQFFLKDGHDPSRPPVGVWCEVRDSKKALME